MRFLRRAATEIDACPAFGWIFGTGKGDRFCWMEKLLPKKGSMSGAADLSASGKSY